MSLTNEPDIKHFCPKTILELDEFIEQNKTPLTFVAGATDLLVQEKRWNNSNNLVSVESVQELNQTLKIDDNGVLIGASLPLTKIISKS